MKFLPLIMLLVSCTVFAEDECKMRSSASLANEFEVGPVTNLIKDKSVEGKCSVTFNIIVDGVQRVAEGSSTGLEQQESLCRYAIENARKNLLVELGGTFVTDTVTLCDDSEFDLVDSIKVGDTILESEVGRSKMNEYFKYHNTKCRMFTQRIAYHRELRVYHGVICLVENSKTNWLVVDKW